MRRTLSTTVTLLLAALSVTACSQGGTAGQETTSAATTTATPTDGASASTPGATQPAGTTIAITIEAGTVRPNGERVKVKLGEPVTLKIDADTDGELHVHSTPEQEIEFSRGTSTKTLVIEQPGIVDVEDHALEQVVVQLQVS